MAARRRRMHRNAEAGRAWSDAATIKIRCVTNTPAISSQCIKGEKEERSGGRGGVSAGLQQKKNTNDQRMSAGLQQKKNPALERRTRRADGRAGHALARLKMAASRRRMQRNGEAWRAWSDAATIKIRRKIPLWRGETDVPTAERDTLWPGSRWRPGGGECSGTERRGVPGATLQQSKLGA
ncbi:uncharacterized protein LOC133545087 isoform X2 [Nerophis ophidion]|uniref:uncharacterized protein LOC133545087 isoform X2 n=1 Tax=Nerophis ophidion TaxID=159077 RepID=UPI002AE06E94|nr:uncharacterized protein LOC133545087 isoform X2 [Nerophis ophidion]